MMKEEMREMITAAKEWGKEHAELVKCVSCTVASATITALASKNHWDQNAPKYQHLKGSLSLIVDPSTGMVNIRERFFESGKNKKEIKRFRKTIGITPGVARGLGEDLIKAANNLTSSHKKPTV